MERLQLVVAAAHPRGHFVAVGLADNSVGVCMPLPTRRAREEAEWKRINEEIALESEGVEPLLDSYAVYANELEALFQIANQQGAAVALDGLLLVR